VGLFLAVDFLVMGGATASAMRWETEWLFWTGIASVAVLAVVAVRRLSLPPGPAAVLVLAAVVIAFAGIVGGAVGYVEVTCNYGDTSRCPFS
jgi:hypothetical protein